MPSLFGAGLHLVTPDGRQAKRRYIACWPTGQHGISVETIMPSMEDVFISLIEEVDRQGGNSPAEGGSLP